MLMTLRWLAVAACAIVPARAWAQEDDFTHLKAKIGQRLEVTGAGAKVVGVLTELTPQRVIVGDREFVPGPGLKIEKRGDPLWNGAAYGFAIGAVLGPTIGAESCRDAPVWHCVVAGGAVWAGIGALIDWAHAGRTTVYLGRDPVRHDARWHVLPIVTPRTLALGVAKRIR
jgi:hypothetical protein